MSQGVIKQAIKRTRMYQHFHVVRHAGLGHLLRRQQIVRQIATVPPRRTCPWQPESANTPIELHMLVRSQDVRMALWSLHSFYEAARVDWPVIFHQGGPMGRADWNFLLSKFPDAHPLPDATTSSVVEEKLRRRGMHNAVRTRRRSVMFHKLVDPLLLSQATSLMMLDSDVLFFHEPTEILAIAGKQDHLNVFNRDPIAYPYTMSADEAMRRFGLRPVANLNAGLSVVNRVTIPLDRIEDYAGDPVVASSPHFVEQTIVALLAAECGCEFLPETYRCASDAGLLTKTGRPLVAKHYIETPRPLLFEEGMRELVRRGIVAS